MTDLIDLQRFLDAQSSIYSRVLDELRHGRKQSHWMWFIFPQLAGLGHSAMAQRFAISSRNEAVAYLGHGVLGPRLKECTALVNAVEGRTILPNSRQSRRPEIPLVDDIVWRCIFRSRIRQRPSQNSMAGSGTRGRWTCFPGRWPGAPRPLNAVWQVWSFYSAMSSCSTRTRSGSSLLNGSTGCILARETIFAKADGERRVVASAREPARRTARRLQIMPWRDHDIGAS